MAALKEHPVAPPAAPRQVLPKAKVAAPAERHPRSSDVPEVPGPIDDVTEAESPGATSTVSDEEGWPSDEAESLARADAAERGETLQVEPVPSEEEEPEKAALPSLEQLVGQVPESVRATLEELFRARWSRVARFKKRDLKS